MGLFQGRVAGVTGIDKLPDVAAWRRLRCMLSDIIVSTRTDGEGVKFTRIRVLRMQTSDGSSVRAESRFD